MKPGTEKKFIEEFEHENGFAQYFEKEILPLKNQIEEVRTKILKTFNKRFKISTFIFIPVLIINISSILLAFSEDGNHIELIKEKLVFIFVTFFILFIITALPVFKYNRIYKKDIHSKIIDFFKSYKYNPKGHIRSDVMENSRLFPFVKNRILDGDHIKGEYKGVSFEFAETRITNYDLNGRNGEKKGTTIFKGVCILFSMNKEFSGRTYVFHDRGFISNWSKSLNLYKAKNVKLEDPEFESKFEVYSTDQVEARYILTTAFMERLNNFETFFNQEVKKTLSKENRTIAEKIYRFMDNTSPKRYDPDFNGLQCSFFNNKIFMAISTKRNFFEPPFITEEAITVDNIKSFLGQIAMVHKLIDTLKLNQKIVF